MGKYTELKQMRSQFLEKVQVPIEEFDYYIPSFLATYLELYPPGKTITGLSGQNHVGKDNRGALAQIEDKLLFIWLFQKVGVGLAALGQQFDMSPRQTSYWMNRLSPVLKLVSEKLAKVNLSPNAVRFLQLLNECEVEYLVVGGVAVAIHGFLRPILDLDIFIATDLLNAQKMVRVLGAFGDVSTQALDFFQMEERVIRIGQPPFHVKRYQPGERKLELGTMPMQFEVLTTISAVSFAECYGGRISAVLEGVTVPVISLEHLKRNKQASIRQKDADDFAHLSQL